jgi:hypothetical protein
VLYASYMSISERYNRCLKIKSCGFHILNLNTRTNSLPNVVVEWFTFLLYFREAIFKISVRRPAISTEDFRVSSQSLQENSVILSGIRPRPLPSKLFTKSSSNYYPFILRYIVWVTEKESLNKLQIKNNIFLNVVCTLNQLNFITI